MGLRDGNGPVERHDRGRGEREELVVEREDLVPVGFGRCDGVAVDGVDRGLELVGTWLVSPQASFDERLAFLDQIVVPEAAILFGKRYELALGGGARGASRVQEQHKRQ